MLDPAKVTILTPGVNAQGTVAEWGIPAAILVEFLDSAGSRSPASATTPSSSSSPSAPPRASGARCSKTSSSSSASTTPTPPSRKPSPSSSRSTPARYRNTTLRELSDEMHKAMIDLSLATLVNEACDEDFDPILTPAQTYQKLVRGETEKVRFSDMPGRIAAVMLVPYPPGIPMSMPGERLGAPESPVIRLILAMEEFGKRFPGFERETHGIETDADGNYWMRAVVEDTKRKQKKNKKAPPSNAPPVNKQRLKIKPVRRSTE